MVLDVPILTTKDVEKLELESQFRLGKLLQDMKYNNETVDRSDGHRRAIVDSERRGRVTASEPIEIIINPASPTEITLEHRLSLPHSYQTIRNLLWIERQPVYKAALLEWQSTLAFFSSKVERKTLRVESLKNEIYRMIGFYSVFQGVLVTATCQSSVLRCRNVGFPFALSFCASLVTLFGILQMFDNIQELDSSIFTERIQCKKAYTKICRLKEEGETFRFNDFPDLISEGNFKRGPSWIIVTVAVSLFSIVFILSHPFILCRQ